MIAIQDTVKLEINESEIKNLIKKTLIENFNKRDNLRSRNPNIQFDCLLRGYVGEKAIKSWFLSHGIEFAKTNYTEDSNGEIDIDLLFAYGNNLSKSIEIKTSLIPDNYVKGVDINDIEGKIKKCIENFDIKLIRRNNESIDSLKGDIHLQIYFGNLRKAKDDFLENLMLSINIQNSSINNSFESLVDKIYDATLSKLYSDRTYFVGWIDKETLIQQIKNKERNEQIWTFPKSKREFWTCKIFSEAKRPIELIEYIKRLQNEN